jgi:hypothetical protein
MALSRRKSLTVAFAQCLIATLAVASAAQAGTVPTYFFKQFTVSSNCAEANAGLAAQVASGLKFQVTAGSGSDASYLFVATNVGQAQWAPNWNGMKLVYRAGIQMTTLPADFECIPGQEASSSFLAMSGYSVSAEPYYEQEHWYGLANIQGQLEHVLIFPQNTASGTSAVIVMQSASTGAAVQLDDNGVIHAE